MNKQSELLKSTNWDVLIILDACRFDTFCSVYFPCYKVNSEAANTIQWLKKHWNGNYERTFYISANPFINSKDIAFSGYKATDHFFKFDIQDLWEETDKYDRTPPESVARCTTSLMNFIVDKRPNIVANPRFIAHFIQPHAPYYFAERRLQLRKLFKGLIPMQYWQWCKKKAPKSVTSLEESYLDRYTPSEIKHAYYLNLKSTYDSVMEIVRTAQKLGLTTVITADHSEYLGEEGRWGHGGKLTEFISTVPWMVIK